MNLFEGVARTLRGKAAFARTKTGLKRESLYNPPEEAEGGGLVVKGISKRIIVVKSPDPKIFEQAIFIVREDYAGETGVSQQEVLRQAQQAVSGYLLTGGSRWGALLPRLRNALYAAAGAAVAALAWVMVQMARVM